ncbi:MAG: hypothetical protein AB7E27_00475 [Candidatus Methanomethylophilaceae archaeon]|jgi:hypothetical protein
MRYKIPDDDTLADAIYMVMHRHSSVRSQGLLASLVSKELSRSDPDYRVSGERVRRLAIIRGLAEVEISYNENGKEEVPSECPVCRGDLRPVSNRTLLGEETVIGHRCRRCSFSMGVTRRTPGMYVFQRKN